jgi:hypothetical protein
MSPKFWLGSLKGKPRYNLEDNIKMDLTDTGLEDVEWIHLAQDRTCSGLL